MREELAVPTVFRAKFFSAEAPCCGSNIERGEPVAYQDEKVVHAVHHDVVAVKERGQAMGEAPPPRTEHRRR